MSNSVVIWLDLRRGWMSNAIFQAKNKQQIPFVVFAPRHSVCPQSNQMMSFSRCEKPSCPKVTIVPSIRSICVVIWCLVAEQTLHEWMSQWKLRDGGVYPWQIELRIRSTAVRRLRVRSSKSKSYLLQIRMFAY